MDTNLGNRITLEEFVSRYLGEESFRGFIEYFFESKEGIGEGILIPEGFELMTAICLFPIYSIFVNKEKNAILKFSENDFSLSIYDSSAHLEAVIRRHGKYFRESIVSV